LNGVASGTAYGCVQERTGKKNLPWKAQHNPQGNDNDDRRDRF